MAKLKFYENTDKFLDLLWDDIDSAKELVCLVTYEMDHKLVSHITVNKLVNAARRGVPVYLIIEDLNCYVDRAQVRRLEAAGATVLRNNPFRNFYYHLAPIFHPRRIFNRTHQKTMLVDGNVYCGSINIAQRYTSIKYGTRAFRDLSIICRGTSSGECARSAREMFFWTLI